MPEAKVERLKGKIEKLKEEIVRLKRSFTRAVGGARRVALGIEEEVGYPTMRLRRLCTRARAEESVGVGGLLPG